MTSKVMCLLFLQLALLLGQSLAQTTAADVGEEHATQDTAAASFRARTEGASLQGLGNVAILIAMEAKQAAGYFFNYVSALVEQRGGDASPTTPCFIEEREKADSSNTDTNFLERLVEDYRSAVDYSKYLQLVRGHFTSDLSEHTYFQYLDEVLRTVNTTTESLANLVRFISESAYQGVTQEISSTKTWPSPSLPEHCSSLCYEQQSRALVWLETFLAVYIPTDVNGYLDSAN